MGRYDFTQKRRPLGPIITVLAALLILGAGAWLYYRPQPVDDSSIKTQELPVPQVSKRTEPKEALAPGVEGPQTTEEGQTAETVSVEPREIPEALPALENSDGFFREQLTALSPGLAAWLNTDDLISKIIVIINDFSQGQRLHKHMRSFKLNEPFTADQDEQGLFVTSKSYQRYNALASAIDAVNMPAALELYERIKPLGQQVFAGFNYPADYQIDDIVKKAAAEILSAPVIEHRIALVRTSVNYQFADKKLEALNPVHKQMIRMGPQNTRIIQNKVRLLMELLVSSDE